MLIDRPDVYAVPSHGYSVERMGRRLQSAGYINRYYVRSSSEDILTAIRFASNAESYFRIKGPYYVFAAEWSGHLDLNLLDVTLIFSTDPECDK